MSGIEADEQAVEAVEDRTVRFIDRDQIEMLWMIFALAILHLVDHSHHFWVGRCTDAFTVVMLFLRIVLFDQIGARGIR